MNETVIRYKFKNKNNLIDVAKISHMGEIRFLQKLDLEGFTYVGYNTNFQFFEIDNQLSRRLKLSLMVDEVVPHKVKFLNDIIKRSELSSSGDLNGNCVLWSSTWCSYNYEDSIDNEKKLRKEENKSRQHFHNNISKQRLKQIRR